MDGLFEFGWRIRKDFGATAFDHAEVSTISVRSRGCSPYRARRGACSRCVPPGGEGGAIAVDPPPKAGVLGEPFALHAFAHELAGATHRFRFLAGAFFRGFFVKLATFHFAKRAFALHFLLQRAQCLFDIIVADENLNDDQGLLFKAMGVVGLKQKRHGPCRDAAHEISAATVSCARDRHAAIAGRMSHVHKARERVVWRRKHESIMTETQISPPFEAQREAVLTEALKRAPFDGWTDVMLREAAHAAGVNASTLKNAFPGGARDVLQFWSERADDAMTSQMAGEEFAALRIREKVAAAVKARIAVLRPHKEAARRAAATLALPHNARFSASLAWRTSDAIWRGLGDGSTDINFYTKRAILSGVWSTTFARWLADDTEDETRTTTFLDRRIDNVMQIEKAKARLRDLPFDPTAPIRFLAKLRYPAGR